MSALKHSLGMVEYNANALVSTCEMEPLSTCTHNSILLRPSELARMMHKPWQTQAKFELRNLRLFSKGSLSQMFTSALAASHSDIPRLCLLR